MTKHFKSRDDFLMQDESYAIVDPETGHIIEAEPQKPSVLFYTTHCPLCYGLENMLQKHNIQYTTIDDIDVIRAKGYLSVPVLEIGEQVFNYKQALLYIRRNY